MLVMLQEQSSAKADLIYWLFFKCGSIFNVQAVSSMRPSGVEGRRDWSVGRGAIQSSPDLTPRRKKAWQCGRVNRLT